MKQFFKITTLLHWISCVGAFLVTTIMYPYNVYYYEETTPFLGLKEFAVLFGIGILLGTVLFLILMLVGVIGKHIGFQKNLIVYFLYHFILCSGFAFGADYLFEAIHFSPYWIYILLGFFPAMLCSIIHSYEMTDAKRHENDTPKA